MVIYSETRRLQEVEKRIEDFMPVLNENLKTLVDLIHRNGGSIGTRELLQKTRRYGRKSILVEQWLELVVELGYGRWEILGKCQTRSSGKWRVFLMGYKKEDLYANKQ